MIRNYYEAIECLIASGTITAAEYDALPRYVATSPSMAGDRPIPIRSLSSEIIQQACVLASMLEDQITEWVGAGQALQRCVSESDSIGAPLASDVEQGLRHMAMAADFAAGLMKAGGLK